MNHRRNTRPWLALLLTLFTVNGTAESGARESGKPEAVLVQNGALTLRGLMWFPAGSAQAPAILFNHGNGCTPQPECDHREEFIRMLGPLFSNHGYVFLALFRRGEGLSAGQGKSSRELMEATQKSRGEEEMNALQVRLLETEQLDDVRAGLAYLRASPRVDARRVAVVGHSFGGSLSLLLAESESTLRAVVAFSPAGLGWQRSRQLRSRLTAAVERLKAPVLLVFAMNDYSVLPGQVLSAEMRRSGKVHRLELFPAHGKNAEQGHDFVYRGATIWQRDVFTFLDQYTKQ